MTLAARWLFKERGDMRIITVFAQRFAASEPRFSSRDVEAVIRGSIGEPHLLDTVEYKTWMRIAPGIVPGLVAGLGLDERGIAELLAVAREHDEATRTDGDFEWPKLPKLRAGRLPHYLGPDDLGKDQPARRRPPRPFSARPQDSAVRTLAGRFVEAWLREEDTDELDEQVEYEDRLRVMQAAMAVAVRLYLHLDPDIREIAALVEIARDRYDAEMDAMLAEYLVRDAFGERVYLADAADFDVFETSAFILATVMDEWDGDDTAVRAVVAEAEATIAVH